MLHERSDQPGFRPGFFVPASPAHRTCKRCRETKPIELFKKSGNGRGQLCKSCDARRARERYVTHGAERNAKKKAQRAANPEPFRARDRVRYWRNLEDHRKKGRERAKSEPGRVSNRAAVRRYQNRFPERNAARRAVARALKGGELVRPKLCQASGCTCAGPLQAHHSNYLRPLDVVWLCVDHHETTHHRTPVRLKPGAPRKFARPPRNAPTTTRLAA